MAIRTKEVSVPMKLQYPFGQSCFNYLITDTISPFNYSRVTGPIEMGLMILKLVVPLNNEELFYFDKYCREEIDYKHNPHNPYLHRLPNYISPYIKVIELSQVKRSEINLRKEMDSALAKKDNEIAELRAIMDMNICANMERADLQSKDEEIASLRAELQSKDEEIASLRDLQAIDGDCRKPRNIDMQVELYEDYGLPSEMASAELIAEQENTSNEAKRQEQYAKRLVPTQEAMSKVAEIMLTIKLLKIWRP